jgi:phospholipase/lecithinase/hemolysin
MPPFRLPVIDFDFAIDNFKLSDLAALFNPPADLISLIDNILSPNILSPNILSPNILSPDILSLVTPTIESLFTNLPTVTLPAGYAVPNLAELPAIVDGVVDFVSDLVGDVGGLIPPDLLAQLRQILTSTYDYVLAEYPNVIDSVGQFLGNLPELNFANPLTINPGNTLNDRSFNQLVVFGDSLSDTGNIAKALGGQFPPSPPFAPSRLSNGPLWVEYLAPALGLGANQVTNLAVAGATSGRSNVAPLSAPGQGLEQLNLPGVLNEIDLFAGQLAASGAAGGPTKANPNALYVVWGGANDFLTLPQDISAAIQSVFGSVKNVAQAVTSLAGLGAKTIVVPNLPNLGVTPLAAARQVVEKATIFSSLFNTLLQGTLGDLESDLGIDIVQVDVFSLVQSIAARPAEFGFKNITTPLFQAALQPSPTPINPDQFAFADDFHPTTAVHRLIGDAFKRSLSAPVPGQVLPTSAALVGELVNSSAIRSALNNLFDDLTTTLLTPKSSAPTLAPASTSTSTSTNTLF